mmetsp:Transcript_14108/g.20779  ORF Transcript_14108/g.20779 Transcript_14108/m.20779 type:complete len:478 (+) Transcript_14108:136-1569(+)
MPKSTPILTTSGMRMMAATVWDTNVAITMATNSTSTSISQRLSRGRVSRIPSTSQSSRPEAATALPSTLPPPSRNSMCHENELKSTWVRNPLPNIIVMKISAMIPRSPKVTRVVDMVDHRSMVPSDKNRTSMFWWVSIFAFLCTMTGMYWTSSGLSMAMRTSQASTTPTTQNGVATAIHSPNPTSTSAFWRALTARAFCMEEMGVIMPPKLQAKARPSSRNFANGLSMGRSLRIGVKMVTHRTGAVWLDIHIDRNSPSSMMLRPNTLGWCPNSLCRKAAICSSSPHRLNAALMLYPPRIRMVTLFTIRPSTFLATPSALSSVLLSSSSMMRSMTTRMGMHRAVAKYGMASVNHMIVRNASIARQRCASTVGHSMNSKQSRSVKVTVARATAQGLTERKKGWEEGSVPTCSPACFCSCSSRSRLTMPSTRSCNVCKGSVMVTNPILSMEDMVICSRLVPSTLSCFFRIFRKPVRLSSA